MVKNDFIDKLTNKIFAERFDYIFRKKVKIKMFEVTYTMNGIIKKISVNASDPLTAIDIFTNMFGGGAIEIIDVVRK